MSNDRSKDDSTKWAARHTKNPQKELIMYFRNEYWFLSNMYPCEIRVNGLVFTCAEACFQSFKTTDLEERKKFQSINGFEAKKLGKKIKLRSDWNDIRIEVMTRVVKAKFNQHPDLADKLKATDNLMIIEDNTWNDTFWGVCNGKGHNLLGRILMNERNRVNAQSFIELLHWRNKEVVQLNGYQLAVKLWKDTYGDNYSDFNLDKEGIPIPIDYSKL